MSDNYAVDDAFKIEFDSTERDPAVNSCLRMWAAKLIIHIRDFASKRTTDEHNANKKLATEWFEDEWDGAGSFIWVCNLFDVDANIAYEKIKAIARSGKNLPTNTYGTKKANTHKGVLNDDF